MTTSSMLDLESLRYLEPVQEGSPRNPLIVRLHFWRACWSRRAALRRYAAAASSISEAAEAYAVASDAVLKDDISSFSQAFRCSDQANDYQVRCKALALLSEVAFREVGQRPYQVQLMAALAMLDEHIVQLAPGEGKTLTLALVAALFAWSGKPCYVVTANDYLAARDAEDMQPLFARCRLKVASIDAQVEPQMKKQGYAADVVYSTAKQLLADYLQDTLQAGGSLTRLSLILNGIKGSDYQPMMRGLHTVIIDEVDSILIDEASVPLIISEPREEPLLVAGVEAAYDVIDSFQPQVHYTIEHVYRQVLFTTAGKALIEVCVKALPPLWQHPERCEDILKQSILARDFYQLDVHYVIDDEKVIIVDEATGRMMPGRSWSGGLHQAIELREGIPMTAPNVTLSKMSFQNFFKLFYRLCGATGTLQNIGNELFFNYERLALEMPSRLPSRLAVKPWHSYARREDRWRDIMSLIHSLHARSHPVLIGTRNVVDSEYLEGLITKAGLNCSLLNAKHHEEEASIISMAGEPGKITVATNMAGRGTDIKVAQACLTQGGLVVVMIEPHESARVDWQLFGRAGRQGNPGIVFPMAALDDDLIRHHLPLWLKPMMPIARIFPNILMGTMVWASQKSAQKKRFKQRQRLNKLDKKSHEAMSFVK